VKAVLGACVDCGSKYTDERRRHFHMDHRSPVTKKFNLSNPGTVSLARYIAELMKCDMRCADCHAARTRSQYARWEL